MNREPEGRGLTTADLAAVAVIPTVAVTPTAQGEVIRDHKESMIENQDSDVKPADERLAPLFSPDVAKDFRSRWAAVQSSFVDDPKQAVRQGDELVAQVMKSLAETFSNERAKLEGQSDQTGQASTENLRVALRRYRSFFERLLSL